MDRREVSFEVGRTTASACLCERRGERVCAGIVRDAVIQGARRGAAWRTRIQFWYPGGCGVLEKLGVAKRYGCARAFGIARSAK